MVDGPDPVVGYLFNSPKFHEALARPKLMGRDAGPELWLLVHDEPLEAEGPAWEAMELEMLGAPRVPRVVAPATNEPQLSASVDVAGTPRPCLARVEPSSEALLHPVSTEAPLHLVSTEPPSPGLMHVGSPTSPGAKQPLLHDELEERLCQPLQTPIVRGPPRLHRPKTPPSVLSLRRSDRLAAKPRDVDSTRQAQCVLMRKMGVVIASLGVDSEPVRKYKVTFQALLSVSKKEALQLIFGGDFDPVAMNLDMISVDGGDT